MFQFFLKKNWWHWSILGSILILFTNWYIVQLDVKINEWFGSFYDIIQKALSDPGTITLEEYYGQLLTFGKIAGLYIFIAVILDFYTKHFIFRWRTSMNDFYTEHWDQLRNIEGAAQRVQEDTRIFANIMEGLGVGFMRSIMILVAFLPILWSLSDNITALPVIGPVDQGLVFVAIMFALAGTLGLATAGIKLPGLQFNNQVVEARYRKELVLGEDDNDRADPPSVIELFTNVRRNYFKLFFHYMYFDVAKWSYLQFGVLVPYIALGPTIIAGVLTLGIMQQIIRAFGKVESSFQFLVNSWTTIVELISVWKRLIEFEKNLKKTKDTAKEF
jgi:peptide/bleomycin uptake transporter|tara:strand:- start:31 stop:1023 length:993 start_codon:yes stop_codon:yes gene_type:complete